MWEFSQVSGPMCHLGTGYRGGLRKGQLHDPELRSQVYSRVGC